MYSDGHWKVGYFDLDLEFSSEIVAFYVVHSSKTKFLMTLVIATVTKNLFTCFFTKFWKNVAKYSVPFFNGRHRTYYTLDLL